MTTRILTAAITVSGLLIAQPVLAQNGQKLGNVSFETSCKPEAQKPF